MLNRPKKYTMPTSCSIMMIQIRKLLKYIYIINFLLLTAIFFLIIGFNSTIDRSRVDPKQSECNFCGPSVCIFEWSVNFVFFLSNCKLFICTLTSLIVYNFCNYKLFVSNKKYFFLKLFQIFTKWR